MNVPKKINEVAELNLKAIKINTSLLLSDLQRTCTEKKINKTKTVRGACGLYPPAVYDRFILDAVCDTRGSKIAAKFIPSFKMSSRFRESNHTRLRRLRAAERAPAGSGSRLRTLAELFEQRVCFLLCVSFTLKSRAWKFSSPEHTRAELIGKL